MAPPTIQLMRKSVFPSFLEILFIRLAQSTSYLKRSLLVGPSGLEPPTSCLSGTRSNLLSYEPMWLVWFPSHLNCGGDDGIRTHDPLLAGQVLSQLSYTPILIMVVLLISTFFLGQGEILLSPHRCQHRTIFPYSLP